MQISLKNNKTIFFRSFHPDDTDKLCVYLQGLSPETKKRFGPHPFDKQSVVDFYAAPVHSGYIACDRQTGEITAYSIIRKGYPEHDLFRLQSYGIIPNQLTDCTFAPSVTDAWQSCGIGKSMFRFILSRLKTAGIKRIILWGGVQSDNEKAINFYTTTRFRTLGQFQYNGNNYDMLFEIP